jgi:hypothetical protein
MSIEDELRDVLFSIGKEIKIHTIGKDMIIEIDYEKYVEQILQIFKDSN